MDIDGIVYERNDNERTVAAIALAGVVTVSEAARLWGKAVASVRYHVNNGSFASRSSGGIILVSVRSIVLIWGKPVNGFPTTRGV